MNVPHAHGTIKVNKTYFKILKFDIAGPHFETPCQSRHMTITPLMNSLIRRYKHLMISFYKKAQELYLDCDYVFLSIYNYNVIKYKNKL